ncbi:hypothetical protein M2S28_04980 [Klebsiella pneumoniae]|nr:hypothetical protein [Klebsiella pneumoniae]MDZ0484261.1 hypothetical protein [Klebsiella pneumoniae]
MLPEHQNQVPQDTTNTPDFTGKQSDNPEFEEVEEDLSKEIIEHPDAFSRVLDRPVMTPIY